MEKQLNQLKCLSDSQKNRNTQLNEMMKAIQELHIEFSNDKNIKENLGRNEDVVGNLKSLSKSTEENLTIRGGQVEARMTGCEDKVEELDYSRKEYQNLKTSAGRDGSAVKSASCSYTGPRFNCQNP